MKASALEFRLRFWIFLVIYLLGFTAPWDHWLHLDGSGPNAHVWGILAALLAKTGAIGILAAFNLLLILAILAALAGAWLRTWGGAYLGRGVVHDNNMHAEQVMAAGPFRYVRNPLYLGTCCNMLAVCLLMPPSGAVFVLVAVVLFQLRLILGEEQFLASKQGEAYQDYCRAVPRLIPSLRPRVSATDVRPHWAQAALAEIFMWGMAVSFAVLGWRYNAELLIQSVLVWLGVSLIARAFTHNDAPAA